MNKLHTLGRHGLIRVTHVARETPAPVNKIQPTADNRSDLTYCNTDPIRRHNVQPVSPRYVSIDRSLPLSTDQSHLKTVNDRVSVQNLSKNTIVPSDNEVMMNRTDDIAAPHSSNWFKTLTTQGKIVFCSIVFGITVLILTVSIIPPVYVYVIRQSPSQSSVTNYTASICSTSTCIGQETSYHSSIVTALYAFDGNLNDLGGSATGTWFGSSGSVSYTVNGYISQALVLSAASQQFVQIPNADLSGSFTIQLWIYTPTLTAINAFGIFGQCDSNLMCLSINIQGGRLSFTFDSLNPNASPLIGSVFLTTNIWVHVTFVYDAKLYQQSIYVNGQLDVRSSGIVSPYQGVLSTSTTTIGKSSSNASGNIYYTGNIDHFIISSGVARSSCQIYNDATLIAYYPFDTSATYNDFSVYYCNGLASGTTLTSGQSNQALSFPLSTSYFQSQCYARMHGALNTYEYSLSLWINPTSVTSGSILHVSSNSYGNGSCYDALVFASNGSLVCQWRTSTPTVNAIHGPTISPNTWTHVAAIYSQNSNVRLYVNGKLSAVSTFGVAVNIENLGTPGYLLLGNKGPLGTASIPNCLNGPITTAPGPYSGSIDEFRLYNRELTREEICVLANL